MSKKMKDMFELPLYVEFFKVDYEQGEWVIVDEENGQPYVLDNNGKNTKFDGTKEECKAFCHAVNTHDSLTEQLEVAIKALKSMDDAVDLIDLYEIQTEALAAIDRMEK